MTEALAEKKCTPCRGGVPPLTLAEAERFRSPNWELHDDGHRIERTFHLGNFREARRRDRSPRREEWHVRHRVEVRRSRTGGRHKPWRAARLSWAPGCPRESPHPPGGKLSRIEPEMP